MDIEGCLESCLKSDRKLYKKLKGMAIQTNAALAILVAMVE